MKATELLDKMLDCTPPSISAETHKFIVSPSIYAQLCGELKRRVRTYKGHKVHTLAGAPPGNVYRMPTNIVK